MTEIERLNAQIRTELAELERAYRHAATFMLIALMEGVLLAFVAYMLLIRC